MEHSILLVEDDELLASNLQTYLERKGFEVDIPAMHYEVGLG